MASSRLTQSIKVRSEILNAGFYQYSPSPFLNMSTITKRSQSIKVRSEILNAGFYQYSPSKKQKNKKKYSPSPFLNMSTIKSSVMSSQFSNSSHKGRFFDFMNLHLSTLMPKRRTINKQINTLSTFESLEYLLTTASLRESS